MQIPTLAAIIVASISMAAAKETPLEWLSSEVAELEKLAESTSSVTEVSTVTTPTVTSVVWDGGVTIIGSDGQPHTEIINDNIPTLGFCPYTKTVATTTNCLMTPTTFHQTVTKTNSVDCSNCATVVIETSTWDESRLGHGPECPTFTATATKNVTTTQTYVCSTSVFVGDTL